MTPIILLLCVVACAITITRVGAVALEITGLSKQSATFQARSAYTNCGFTTGEAEKVVNHPVRRTIIMFLMFLGHLGIASVAGTVLLTVMQTEQTGRWGINLAILGIGIAILLFVGSSRYVYRITEIPIRWCLIHWTRLDTKDYSGLLHLSHGYVVSEMVVRADDWLADRALKELLLSKEGVLILGIEKQDGTYIGTPEGYHVLREDDLLILYGNEDRLKDLDQRRKGYWGDQGHAQAVVEQLEVEYATNEALEHEDRDENQENLDEDQ